MTPRKTAGLGVASCLPPGMSQYEDIIRQGQEVFFQDFAEENAKYYLADSSGACIDNFRPGMTIRQYMYACGTQPSKLRIYVLQRKDIEVCDV